LNALREAVLGLCLGSTQAIACPGHSESTLNANYRFFNVISLKIDEPLMIGRGM
jgi:hypothetical protein